MGRIFKNQMWDRRSFQGKGKVSGTEADMLGDWGEPRWCANQSTRRKLVDTAGWARLRSSKLKDFQISGDIGMI